jgi:hypothetical protein
MGFDCAALQRCRSFLVVMNRIKSRLHHEGTKTMLRDQVIWGSSGIRRHSQHSFSIRATKAYVSGGIVGDRFSSVFRPAITIITPDGFISAQMDITLRRPHD